MRIFGFLFILKFLDSQSKYHVQSDLSYDLEQETQLYVAAATSGQTSRIVDTRPKVLVSSFLYDFYTILITTHLKYQ